MNMDRRQCSPTGVVIVRKGLAMAITSMFILCKTPCSKSVSMSLEGCFGSSCMGWSPSVKVGTAHEDCGKRKATPQ